MSFSASDLIALDFKLKETYQEPTTNWTMHKRAQFRFFSQSKQKAKNRIGRKLRGLK